MTHTDFAELVFRCAQTLSGRFFRNQDRVQVTQATGKNPFSKRTHHPLVLLDLHSRFRTKRWTHATFTITAPPNTIESLLGAGIGPCRYRSPSGVKESDAGDIAIDPYAGDEAITAESLISTVSTIDLSLVSVFINTLGIGGGVDLSHWTARPRLIQAVRHARSDEFRLREEMTNEAWTEFILNNPPFPQRVD